uniref:Zona pellucida domain-containing protein n=1 Tax=Daphnia magna TaxID=35525 RepID=A0A0P5KYS3_9CRUS
MFPGRSSLHATRNNFVLFYILDQSRFTFKSKQENHRSTNKSQRVHRKSPTIFTNLDTPIFADPQNNIKMKRRLSTWFLLAAILIQSTYTDKVPDSSVLPLEHRGVDINPIPLGAASSANKRQIPLPPNYIPSGPGLLPPPSGGLASYPPQGSPIGPASEDQWPIGQPSDQPQIKNLQVQCEKTHMRVNIEFDRPFYGMIFSKGHYSDSNCVHVRPGSGQLSATFDVYLNSCGMTSSANQAAGGAYGAPSPAGTFVENTIIIQYDPLVQEVWDQARRLRCTWYDYYEKSVTFRPFAVDMLNAVTANFLGDNLQCWMQIQVGKGPWASEVSGIVKIGQTMTMVLAIKDDENKFDMLVRNCVAHDGLRAPIQLVDQYGCVTRPKIMSRFQKVRNFGQSASVVSYAYFQAFKFPDSMNVHFQCVIQVCRNQCPEPKCDAGAGGLPGDLGYAASSSKVVGVDPRVPGGPGGAAPPQSLPVNRGGPQPNYKNVNRAGEADESESRQFLGKPRMVSANATDGIRSRRSADEQPTILHVYKRDAQDMTDVPTTRFIQVVAPGDVAFTLNPNQNETVVVQNLTDMDGNHICLSVPSFVGGLTMLLLVLIIACMVAVFLLLRVRQFDGKGKSSSSLGSLAHIEHPEFVKVSNCK